MASKKPQSTLPPPRGEAAQAVLEAEFVPQSGEPGAPVSPLLDMIAAVRANLRRIIVSVVVGGILFFALGQLQPTRYPSESAIITQPDLLGVSMAEVVDLPGSKPLQAFTGAQIFERVISSAWVIERALNQLSTKYDNLLELDLEGLEDTSPTRRQSIMTRAVRQGALGFEYDQFDPTVTFTVSTPYSADYARDLAKALITNASDRLTSIRLERRAETARQVKEGLAATEQEALKAENEYAQFLVENRLANDPLTIQKREQMAKEVETKRAIYDQLRMVAEKFTFSEPSASPSFTLVDGPSPPLKAIPVVPYTVCGVLGAAFGLFLTLIWIAYQSHLQAMRRMNPDRYR